MINDDFLLKMAISFAIGGNWEAEMSRHAMNRSAGQFYIENEESSIGNEHSSTENEEVLLLKE